MASVTIVSAVVLAAGRSTRMGRPKANLPLAGETFLTRIIGTFHAAGIDDVIVVLGHEANAIAPVVAASGRAARLVINANYDRGQLSSLVTGIDAADRPDLRAILMTLVDVPLFSAATVRAVVNRYDATHAAIVRPINGPQHGHPILIDRSLFGVLRATSDDEGAKPVVRGNATSAGDVAVDDAGAFQDIDTMDEYQRLIADGGGDRRNGRSPFPS